MSQLSLLATALLEPNLLIPGKKPVGPVEVDWSNPLTKGLVGCYLFDTKSRYYNFANPKFPATVGGNQTFDGDSAVIDASGEYIRVNPTDFGINGKFNKTLVYQKRHANGTYPRPFQRGDANIAPLYRDANDYDYIIPSVAVTGVATNFWDGNIHVMSFGAADFQSNRGIKFTIDGVLEKEVIGGAAYPDGMYSSSARYMMIGNRYDTTRWNGGGNLAFFLHDRQLTALEQKIITTDPYQILKPVGLNELMTQLMGTTAGAAPPPPTGNANWMSWV